MMPSLNRTHGRNDAGAVFIDVLTSMTFVLLLLALSQTWARALLYSHRTLEVVATTGQDAALAVDAVARDIRNAGFGMDPGVAPIAAAGIDFLELTADHNADGDLDDAHERLRYAYRADRRQLTRASGRGSPQPFADDLAPDGLRFSYKDTSGDDIPVGDTGLDEAALRRIRRIEIDLILQPRNPDPRATTPIEVTAALAVDLRNR